MSRQWKNPVPCALSHCCPSIGQDTAIVQLRSERLLWSVQICRAIVAKELEWQKDQKTWRGIKENSDGSIFISRHLLQGCIYIRYNYKLRNMFCSKQLF